MGGIILPNGYSYLAGTIYNTNTALKTDLKDGKDLVKITVVDSRGNTTSKVKELNVDLFSPPYFTSLEAVRQNDIDEPVRLKAQGKLTSLGGEYSVNYIEYWSSDTPFIDGQSSHEGNVYGPFQIDISKIVYSSDGNEFTVESLLQGDLGANGFTKEKKFYIKFAIATSINFPYPLYFYTTVETGKYLMVIGPDGIEGLDTNAIDYAYVVNNDASASTGYWFKVASGSVTQNADANLVFCVVQEFEKNMSGILHMHIRQGRTIPVDLWWESISNPRAVVYNNYAVVWSTSGTQVNYELWHKIPSRWYATKFTVIDNSNRELGGITNTVFYKLNGSAQGQTTISGNIVYSTFPNEKPAEILSYRFPIFGIAGDTPVNAQRNLWVMFGNVFYNYKTDVDKIPVPVGYTRYVQIMAVLTDNCTVTTSPGIVIGVFDNGDNFLNRSFNFENVWGATTNARMNRTSTNRFNYNEMPSGWYVFKCIIPNAQQDGAVGQIRYAEVQIIDVKNT